MLQMLHAGTECGNVASMSPSPSPSTWCQEMYLKQGRGHPAVGKGYEAHVRQTLGHPDFLKNLQKTLFGTFSDAGKKPSKNLKKTLRRPQKF